MLIIKILFYLITNNEIFLCQITKTIANDVYINAIVFHSLF